MAEYVQDEDEIILYWERFNKYLIPVRDGGTSGILIRYCPWCGTRLPPDRTPTRTFSMRC
jgi:hypothetical protein